MFSSSVEMYSGFRLSSSRNPTLRDPYCNLNLNGGSHCELRLNKHHASFHRTQWWISALAVLCCCYSAPGWATGAVLTAPLSRQQLSLPQWKCLECTFKHAMKFTGQRWAPILRRWSMYTVGALRTNSFGKDKRVTMLWQRALCFLFLSLVAHWKVEMHTWISRRVS